MPVVTEGLLKMTGDDDLGLIGSIRVAFPANTKISESVSC